MTFEEILPLLRSGQKVRRRLWANGWMSHRLQEHMWMEFHESYALLRFLFGDARLSAEDLNATDWELYSPEAPADHPPETKSPKTIHQKQDL